MSDTEASMSMAEAKEPVSSQSSSTDVTEKGKNKNRILCERCSSVILLSGKASIKEKEFFLPYMKKKPNATPEEGETVGSFWLVDDMFTFENLGFTNTCSVNGASIKYLICADCEVGPIGIHNIADKKEFYVSVDRVKQEQTTD